MGIIDQLGMGSFNTSIIVDKIYSFIGIFLLLFVLGGIITAFIFFKSKKKKKGETSKIGWWIEVGNRMEPSIMDNVEEIVIPGTTLRIFYCREKNLWLPRFNLGITRNLYYVLRTPSNQMINFSIPSLTKTLKEANIQCDHTDMLWAAENSREFIKRNYTDKSIKWWQAYQNTISTAILILIMTFSFVLIIYFMRGIVTDLGGVVNQISEWSKNACIQAQSSGVKGG